jgi:hypothetical protein
MARSMSRRVRPILPAPRMPIRIRRTSARRLRPARRASRYGMCPPGASEGASLGMSRACPGPTTLRQAAQPPYWFSMRSSGSCHVVRFQGVDTMKKLAVLSAAALIGLGAVASTTAEAGPPGRRDRGGRDRRRRGRRAPRRRGLGRLCGALRLRPGLRLRLRTRLRAGLRLCPGLPLRLRGARGGRRPRRRRRLLRLRLPARLPHHRVVYRGPVRTTRVVRYR